MVDLRIDTTMNTSAAMQPEWCEAEFMRGLVFVADLGCLDAPDCMPAGSVRRSNADRAARIPSFCMRGAAVNG